MSGPARKLSIEGDRLPVPASALGHAGFRTWVTSPTFPERVRAAFIDGEVLLEMSPEALETHNKVKQAVTAALVRIASAEDLGETYADGMLLTNTSAGLSTEPDFLFASWATLESGRLRKVPRASGKPDCVELEGAPDLVVEIVSDSSVRKDTKLLRAGYARAGVREYWLIDARGDALRFEILRLDRRTYAGSRSAKGTQASRVLGRRFALRRRRNRIGGWTYELSAVAGRAVRLARGLADALSARASRPG